MLNNKNMSSPFQQKFSGKSPFRNEGVVTLSEQDIKNAKSASSQPAKEISYEGQGGKDYENRPEDATNPEGQGGIDYESKDYKKKTDVSPLNSYENPRGEVYLSDQPAFQQLQSQIQNAADKIIASATDEKTEAHLSKRQKRREDRRTILEDRGVNQNRLDKFDVRSKKVDDKKVDATTKLRNKEQAQKDYNEWLKLQKNPTEVLIKAKKESLGIN